MEPNLYLKVSLQAHGALRPQAWQDIQNSMQTIQLYPGESLVRAEGNLAFVDAGILKEYDPHQRIRPSVIAFLTKGIGIITRRHNQGHFIKAITKTVIYQWDQSTLNSLHQNFPELKSIYLALCAGYDYELSRRSILLELPSRQRITFFKEQHSLATPYLKKKDIANYLHLNYSYLVDKWNVET